MSDILNSYANEFESIKLSEFVITKKPEIVKMEYNMEITFDALKSYWCDTCREFADRHKIRFKNDCNVVDWAKLCLQIKLNQTRRIHEQTNADANILKETLRKKHFEEFASLLLNPNDTLFMEVDDSLEGKALKIQKIINDYRNSSTYEKNVNKQDVLYFGIVDLVRRGKSSATQRMLREYLPQIRERVNTIKDYNPEAKNFAKYILSDSKLRKKKIKTEKKKIKREKKLKKQKKMKKNIKIKDKEINDISIRSSVIRIINLVLKMTRTFDKDDWINTKMTESEFTTRFLTPLGDCIVKGKDCVFRPGEQPLELVKQYENNSLYDDETRLPGPRIDGLIISSIFKIPFVLFEVSGPPCDAAANYSHFKGDRNKIAINLKFLFKQIITSKGIPTLYSSKNIKLFGVHVYRDKIYVYSLSMPLWDLYIFNLEFNITIPSKIKLFPSTIPKFINKIITFSNVISSYHKQIEEYLETQDYGFNSDSSDLDLSTCSSPCSSLGKRKYSELDQ